MLRPPFNARTLRLIGAAIFFAGVFLFPWFVTLGVGAFLLFRFGAYEVVLGGIIMDALYAPQEFLPLLPFLPSLPPLIMTSSLAALAALAFFLRRRILVT